MTQPPTSTFDTRPTGETVVDDSYTDVIVVGGGNAGLCAALAARQRGARVLVLDAAPVEARGGNSLLATGTLRVSYQGMQDVKRLVPELSDDEMVGMDVGAYSESSYMDDLGRLSDYRLDVDLADQLARTSLPTLLWMARSGVRYTPTYGRQAVQVGGRHRFWGGIVVEVVGGGQGLVDALSDALRSTGGQIAYDMRAEDLIEEDGTVTGVVVRDGRWRAMRLHAKSIVIATGGFEANRAWRAQYLGPGWDLARVRGSRFSQGDGIGMALRVGAVPWGHWSGCHASAWDRNAPEFGDELPAGEFSRHSYPYGIMVNAAGKRFVDEGADFRTYTYARYGGEILNQPHAVAWQVFDQKVSYLLRSEYRSRTVTKVTAVDVNDLVGKLDDIDKEAALATIRSFNQSIDQTRPFDPADKDGRAARGVPVVKSNWAQAIDEPPFEAYAVTCGITFTYGGLRIDNAGAVLDLRARPIRGLFAAGGVVGGLYFGNAPSGSSLVAGSVQGRVAGAQAAEHALGLGPSGDDRRT